MDLFVMVGCLASAAGGFAALPLADKLLKKKKAAFDGWWDASLRGWKAFRQEHGRDPQSKARGREGALGVWARAQRDDAARGALTESRLERLLEADFEFGTEPKAVPDSKFQYSMPWTADKCAYLALGAVAAWCLVVWLSGVRGPWSAVIGCAFGLSIALGGAMTACDVRARVIPWELCAAMAAAGAVLALCMNGLSGLAWTTGAAAVFWAALWLFGKIFRMIGREGVGGGDLRAAPAAVMMAGVVPHSALASGAVWGGLVAAAGLVAWLAVGLARGKVALSGSVPLGPFFAAWATTGIIATLFV